jgi:GT2 family glycosyltransferase
MDLSIVIVNWQSIEFVRDCIKSIHKTAHALKYELIVVDNASEPDACRQLKSPAPLRVVCADRNLGFARANNLGVEHSCSENVLFLNPDTTVVGNALPRMLSALCSSPEIGAVGCRLLNGDLTLQTSCVQPFPTLANQLLGIELVKRRCPTLPIWGMRALFLESTNTIVDVETVSGACIMVKRNVFEAVGGFSADYFLYGEELDLCHKIRQQRWRVCHVRDAQVIHFGGQSTPNEGGISDAMMRDSVYLLLRKVRGKGYAEVYRVLLLISALTRVGLCCLLLVVPGNKISNRARSAIRKWWTIAYWSMTLRSRKPRDLHMTIALKAGN